MRHFFISLALILLLMLSVAIGIAVARWPVLMQSWHDTGHLG
jgi:hypothetical protein